MNGGSQGCISWILCIGGFGVSLERHQREESAASEVYEG